MTYLELVQSLVKELGLGGSNNTGTVPTTTVSQTGQLGDACNWIAQSILDIENTWRDWDFLQTDYSETLTVGSRSIPAHSGAGTVREWDKRSFFLNYAGASPTELTFVDWRQFRPVFDVGNHPTAGQPRYFSIKPNKEVILDTPPEQAYTLSASFWKKPTLISGDGTEPNIPDNYDRVIIAGAAIKYGNKAAAAEVIDGMAAEYEVGFLVLQSEMCPSFNAGGMSGDDQFLEMEIPNTGDWG